MKLTPRSLILDLMATLPLDGSQSMPVRALVEAGECFGLASNSVRVALARLNPQGRVERDERGRYRQGRSATSATRFIRGWRQVGSGTRSWSGAWVAVQCAEARARGKKKQDALALRFFGFSEFQPGLAVRPDNLAGGVDGTRASLFEAGLSPSSLVGRLSDLGPEAEARARRLWDVDQLQTQYRETTRALLRSQRQLRKATDEEGMVETFHVGGRAIRQLVLDPRLPEAMLDPQPREKLVSAMIEYDRFGRACWAPFMRRHGVVPRRARASLPFEAGSGVFTEAPVGAEAI